MLPVPQCLSQGPAAQRWEPNNQGRGNDVLLAPPAITVSHRFFQPHVHGSSWTETQRGLETQQRTKALQEVVRCTQRPNCSLSPMLTQPSWQQCRCPHWDCLHSHLFAVQRSAAVTISDRGVEAATCPEEHRGAQTAQTACVEQGERRRWLPIPRLCLMRASLQHCLAASPGGGGMEEQGIAWLLPSQHMVWAIRCSSKSQTQPVQVQGCGGSPDVRPGCTSCRLGWRCPEVITGQMK